MTIGRFTLNQNLHNVNHSLLPKITESCYLEPVAFTAIPQTCNHTTAHAPIEACKVAFAIGPNQRLKIIVVAWDNADHSTTWSCKFLALLKLSLQLLILPSLRS